LNETLSRFRFLRRLLKKVHMQGGSRRAE